MTYYNKKYYPKRPVKSFQDLEVYQKLLAVSVAIAKKVKSDRVVTLALNLPVQIATAHSLRFSDPGLAIATLEQAIRADMPRLGLHLHPSFQGQQTATLLAQTLTQSQNLSPQTILLFSQGLTKAQLDKVIAFAADPTNSNTQIGRLYRKHLSLFGTLRQQIDTIEKTDTPQANTERATSYVKDKDNARSPLTQLFNADRQAFQKYLDLAVTNTGKQIINWAKANPQTPLGRFYQANANLFGKINTDFEKVKSKCFCFLLTHFVNKKKRVIPMLGSMWTSLFKAVQSEVIKRRGAY